MSILRSPGPLLPLAVYTVLSCLGSSAQASSHSDAPLIKQDPQANLTDVYAFIGRRYDDPGRQVLNVLVQVRPFSEPGDGPIHDRFADDARYSIHITDPATGGTVIRYDFLFSAVAPVDPPALKNPDTILTYGLGTELGPILALGDARQNYTQTYEVQRSDLKGKNLKKPTTIASGLLTPPPNVGRRTTPFYNDQSTGFAISGATVIGEMDSYTRSAIHDLPDDGAVWAGPRDDGFYADTPGIFDLLDPRTLGSGGGIDGLKGFNALAYGIQIPIETLPSFPYAASVFGQSIQATGVGVYASVSRGNRKLKRDGTQVSSKPKVQVNRMGNPLFNERMVALRDKDNYNHTIPINDAQFASYALEPELALFQNAVFGTSFVATGRADLVAMFIPDVLRVNTATGPVRLAGQAGFNRLGFLGGDITGGASGGWPNGRRPGDDVVDILLTAIASGPSYASINLRGDSVNANDQVYNQVFPYLATPHSGAANRNDP